MCILGCTEEEYIFQVPPQAHISTNWVKGMGE